MKSLELRLHDYEERDVIYEGHKCLFIHINKTGGGSIARALKDGRHHPSFDQIHWKMQRYARNHPEEISNCFKFTFVRNPWDKVLSQYFFRQNARFTGTGSSGELSFSEFVKKPAGFPFQSQLEWFMVDGSVGVDFIGRFENLQDDFNRVCDRIGCEQRHLGSNNKTDHRHYSHYYDDESRQRVAEIYREDIILFDYEFEDRSGEPALEDPIVS